MAKNTIADLDTTTGNNQDVLGQSTLGSADANQLDAVDRSTLALLARFYADLGGVVTVGGSGNAITVTSASTYQTLENGLVIAFKAGAANTGATTLNLDSLGAKAVRRKGDTALAAGDIAANGRYLAVYDAAYNSSAGAWVLMNPELPANAARLDTQDQVVTGGTRVTSLALNSGSAVTSGTLTLDPGDCPLQHYTNGGAHTLAPGSNTGYILLDITNNGSAGAITTSGWTKVVGSFTTTNGHKFRCGCSIGNGGSLLTIQALQ
jgi:hypothetical protein